MSAIGALQKIRETVEQWKGVTVHPHRFGGVEFRMGKSELDHLHGNRLLDIPLSMKVRNELIEAGVVEPHPATFRRFIFQRGLLPSRSRATILASDVGSPQA